jgi:pimeloyl-ACP methyl ester carboxylesterase
VQPVRVNSSEGTLPQRHTIGVRCGIDNTCRAHWSLQPTGKLIFFVHGFGGSATATWRNFPELLLSDSRWSGWDLFFYGYDSRRVRAGINAQLLETQIENVISSGYANAWLANDRLQNFAYNEIWLVAHSLGAVVTRRAIIDAARRQAAWLGNSHLICFAPASTGARIEKLAWWLGISAGAFTSILHAYLRFKWPVADDLKIGSPFLRQLLRDTGGVNQAGREPFLSRLTLYGSRENVVDYPPPFRFDNQIRIAPKLDHFSICKPKYPHDKAYFELVQEVRP